VVAIGKAGRGSMRVALLDTPQNESGPPLPP